MNAITKTEAARPSLIAAMAAQRNMDPDQFAKTVRATVMPAQHTNEQFAALMLVADKYDLDPILKEIYAFPAKGGGIVSSSHLVSSRSVELSEFEFGLIVAWNAFSR